MLTEIEKKAMKEKTYFKWNGVLYKLYWDTALDGKTWCRVKVLDKQGNEMYQYRYYFRTKKAAQIHIIATHPLKKAA